MRAISSHEKYTHYHLIIKKAVESHESLITNHACYCQGMLYITCASTLYVLFFFIQHHWFILYCSGEGWTLLSVKLGVGIFYCSTNSDLRLGDFYATHDVHLEHFDCFWHQSCLPTPPQVSKNTIAIWPGAALIARDMLDLRGWHSAYSVGKVSGDRPAPGSQPEQEHPGMSCPRLTLLFERSDCRQKEERRSVILVKVYDCGILFLLKYNLKT